MKPPTKSDEIWRDWFNMTEDARQPEAAPRPTRTSARLPMGTAALAAIGIVAVVVGSRFAATTGSAGARPSSSAVPPSSAAAVTTGTSGSPATTNAPSGVPSPSAEPVSASGFYLRAWRTQALPAQYTFPWLPLTTISDGQFIDGQVAVDAIYPGPAYVAPTTRSITDTALGVIFAEARRDGLVGIQKEFGTQLAGGMTCHVELKAGGKTSDLSGTCPAGAITGTPAPGSDKAFWSFWNRITNLQSWVGAELGQSMAFAPVKVDVLLTPPVDATGGIVPNETPWPLTSTFRTFGTEFSSNMRCGTVTGTDLSKLLAVVKTANELTRFVDSTNTRMSLVARPLVPGEASNCS
jgi:hypothetical protein